jgi:hypothetical protein
MSEFEFDEEIQVCNNKHFYFRDEEDAYTVRFIADLSKCTNSDDISFIYLVMKRNGELGKYLYARKIEPTVAIYFKDDDGRVILFDHEISQKLALEIQSGETT